ncbi:mechanosensitive ion channel family protein [Riemerella columbipharyngis]|uniref:Small conductance mechanosensitive channel n=1 Tax=Riemerella columbipharyngis TaxID=1071918 RepID=A0A1G7DXV4_9FLAO|nr:mechanosensitive ion channel domain-containing protein [Riemerella columbipharyngis]SDE56221.1 small conductance mechanosensitive channel [Riemerella columbipharyngis]
MKNINLSDINISHYQDKIVNFGVSLVVGILIIIIGFWIASWVGRLIKKQFTRSELSVSLRSFIADLVAMLIRILVILVAMNTLGVQTTSFVALLGGLAVGIGMALQGSLANFAGGLLILLFKPFKVGDTVEVMGNTGTVQEISILQTIMLMPNMKTVILPNGSVFNSVIINYSKSGERRIELEVGIGYEDDFDKAKAILLDILKNEPTLIHDKGYVVEINEFGESSVNLAIYAYVKSADYMATRWKLNREVKTAFDANGIDIPCPQRYIHIVPDKKES